MKTKPFNLEEYLADPSKKVVTRKGNPVRIICTDAKLDIRNTKGKRIIALVTRENETEMTLEFYSDGTFYRTEESYVDLFFGEEPETIDIPFGAKDSEFIKDEYFIPEGCEARIEGNKVIIEKVQKEEELTELQKTLEDDCDCYVNLYNDGKPREELREWIKCWCHRIIDLARKELEKDYCIMEPIRCFRLKAQRELGETIGRTNALKDLPKWKKITKPEQKYLVNGFISWDDYYLSIGELKRKLPKEK